MKETIQKFNRKTQNTKENLKNRNQKKSQNIFSIVIYINSCLKKRHKYSLNIKKII